MMGLKIVFSFSFFFPSNDKGLVFMSNSEVSSDVRVK